MFCLIFLIRYLFNIILMFFLKITLIKKTNKRSIVYQTQNTPNVATVSPTDNNLRPAVAISMGGKCKVYNAHGDLMNYTYAECQDFLSEVGKLPNARTSHKFVSSHDGGQSQSQEPTFQEVNPNAVSTL